eukprot:COSAG01_NODE_22247_length_864_cov_1.741176_1_plen_42_part_01
MRCTVAPPSKRELFQHVLVPLRIYNIIYGCVLRQCAVVKLRG